MSNPYERRQVSIVLSFDYFQINFQDIFILINISKFQYGLGLKSEWKYV